MSKEKQKIKKDLARRIKTYYITAIFSLVFAVMGFSYNLWRMKVNEKNSTIRTASFEVLRVLGELEQNIYAAHYDQDTIRGNARIGWVKVGLIHDLSVLISPAVTEEALELKRYWGKVWDDLPDDNAVANKLVENIDAIRAEIRLTIEDIK